MLIRLTRGPIVALTVTAVLLQGCSLFGPRKPRPGKTTGQIFVDSPEVYSRERLVQDRLDQQEWLRSQLALVDKLDFGSQGLSDVRTIVGLSSSTGLQADSGLVLYRQQLENQQQALSQQSEISALDHRIAMLEKLQRIEDLENGTDGADKTEEEGDTEDEDDSQESDSAAETPDLEIPGSPPDVAERIGELAAQLPGDLARPASGVKPSPIDLFRDRLAYREEVRNELIETGLDDRHDLAGGTLYRLKFDVTLLPDDDTSAWAVVAVKLKGPHDESGQEFKELYDDWRDYLQKQMRDELQARYRWLDEEQERQLLNRLSSDYDRWYYYVLDAAEKDRVIPSARAQEEPSDPLALQIDRLLRGFVKLDDFEHGLPPYYDNYKKKMEEVEELQREDDVDKKVEELRRAWIEYLLIEEVQDQLRPYIQVVRHEGITIKSGDQGEFKDKLLEASAGVWAYAVTPKESVQRLSDVSARRAAVELSLGLGALIGSVGIENYTQYSNLTETLLQAIKRQPLVVGFSGDYGSESSTFGWIMGPVFEIEPKAQAPSFRHRTVQNNVAALVSVPAWWRSARVEVTRTWQTEKGKTRSLGMIPYDIELPGELSAITSALSPKWKRNPRPSVYQETHLEIGKPGTVVIPGTDLWRNPVVLLGTQRADDITVLPNMEGLLVTFKRVPEPVNCPIDQQVCESDLYIWTSEGRTYVDTAHLHRPRRHAGIRKVALAVPRVVIGVPVKLQVVEGAVTGGFAEARIGVRRAGSLMEFASLEVLRMSPSGKEIEGQLTTQWLATSFTPPLSAGEKIELALLFRATPGSQRAIHSGGMAVFYPSVAEAGVQLVPASSSDLPLVATVTFPKTVQDAYPGFSDGDLSFEARLREQPSVAITARVTSLSPDKLELTVAPTAGSEQAWATFHTARAGTIVLTMTGGVPGLSLVPTEIAIPKKS